MTTLNGIIVGMVCAASLGVMVMWHIRTRGGWHAHPSGKSMMALLGVIAAITGLATTTILAGPIAHVSEVYGVLYVLLLIAVFQVGAVILYTHRRHDDDEPPTEETP